MISSLDHVVYREWRLDPLLRAPDLAVLGTETNYLQNYVRKMLLGTYPEAGK